MKNILLLILAVTAVNFSFAQSRYFVYFEDKGITSSHKLVKSSHEFNSAKDGLTHKSIERRIKNMGAENFITLADVPVKIEYIQEIEKLGVEIYRNLKWLNAVSCILSEEQIVAIRKLPFVNKIERVKTFIAQPDDLFVRKNSALKEANRSSNNFDYGPSFDQYFQVDVIQVHRTGLNGEGVIIGLIDTGFDWRNHHATQNLDVIDEYDFIFNDGITSNEEGDQPNQHNHGTSVLSIAGGYDPGNIIGPAFGASFILAKTENVASETRVEEDNYIAALEWQESLGVDIISSSIGYSIFDTEEDSYTYEDMNGRTSPLTIASELAFERGVITVTSAGNSGNDPWYYITIPADGDNIISVGAVNYDNQLAHFSSHGPTYDGRIKPEVVAPGVSVYMANPQDSFYMYANGTSFSSPIVAGIAGLLFSAYPHLTNRQVRDIILKSGNNSQSPNNDYGFGLISAEKAIAFPNLSSSDERYTLHKIFFDSDGISEESPELHYSVNGGNYISEYMDYNGEIGYSIQLPILIQGDSFRFFFTYRNDLNSLVRSPAGSDYRVAYGNLNIELQSGVEVEPSDPVGYSLLQNFPNPFNDQTRIVFQSETSTQAKVTIYDVLGRKVKNLFDGVSVIGPNTIYWDGNNSEGRRCVSGPYFFTLSIDGKFFSKKLIFIK